MTTGGLRDSGHLLVMVAWLASAMPGWAANVPTPGAVYSDVARFGPHQTVRHLIDLGAWEDLISHIGSGDGAYIALVPALRRGSDAGTSEDLTIGLAQALRQNPAAVLRVVRPSQDPVRGACLWHSLHRDAETRR